ncbi:hypothetical protein F2Q69_00028794 [Brassica cretica]|uniref:Uncharacterized protein n=1 Tax=Brassica cretica TaxID=69181 RepID=A0A8S9SAK4_BRACR|nr:hypothetical protein F2Q69_00028794 [Brassica cretica]
MLEARYMPSSTRSNKETQLLFSPDLASLERSICKEARSSSTDNITCVNRAMFVAMSKARADLVSLVPKLPVNSIPMYYNTTSYLREYKSLLRVHAQQYQEQQGNSTAILTRSCKFGTFDLQGSALLIDRQHHLCVARFCSTTVDPDTSSVDVYSLTTVDRQHSPSIDQHTSSDIDRYSIPDIDRY